MKTRYREQKPEELLKIRNLSSSYRTDRGELMVLKGIDFSVQKGEVLSIIGPSGCGKTTLLRLIAGFLRPVSGEILLKGRTITAPGTDRIMIFQDFNQLFPWLTVLQNVAFPLKTKKVPREERERLARQSLQSVQLADFLNFYPHQLSGGMKQRVALARALITGPEILLMDEPFGSLDEQTRASLQKLLLKIWQKTRNTIIFVTHDIREAIKIADRIVVLKGQPGQVREIILNDLPRPRKQTAPEFMQLFSEIYGLL